MAMTAQDWLVSRWMSSDLITATTESHLIDVFELMREHRIRHIPVVEDGALEGIVSDRDVRHALPMRSDIAEGDQDLFMRAMQDTPVGKIMTRHPITVTSDTTIREAAEIVCREKIGALPVVDGGALVGIVSAEDLLWGFVENTAEAEAGV
jgi:acetoin utilization protein AcuB